MTVWHPQDYIGFDFETSGTLPEYALQPWRVAQKKAWATSLVWIHEEIAKGGLEPTAMMMRAMLETAIAKKQRIVGWNVVFDIAWLLAYGLEDLVFKCKWLDGMLLWKHATIEPEYGFTGVKRKSFGLKGCVAELWSDEAGYEEDIDFHDPDPEVRAKLHAYNIKDVDFTLRGAEHWWNRLTNIQQGVALIEAECLPHVAAANLRGLPVDTLMAHDLQQWLVDRAEDLLDRLSMIGVTEKIARSPTQLAALLYDDWKLPVLKLNKLSPAQALKGISIGTRSTDKEVLHELALGDSTRPPDPRIKALKEYREALNAKTKFADAPLESVDYNEDGRTHPHAFVFSTYTGRLTYASKQGKNKDERQVGFAIHQEKRDPRYRKIIIPPPGHKLMEFDAAGQEYRWMAVASRDTTMLNLCMPNEDPHSFMGSRIIEMSYKEFLQRLEAKEERIAGPQGGRMLGKVANLSLQYRTSPPRLRTTARVDYNIPMELPEAERVHRTYKNTYPAVPVYWQFQIDMTKRSGYVETFAGRRVKVEGSWYGEHGWSMGSTAINYRIQGTGADQKYLALAVLGNHMRQYDVKFVLDMHDGLYFFVPDPSVGIVADRFSKLLNNLPYQQAWGMTLPIPMPFDCKIGSSWGGMEKWKG